jgi:glycosyltransferase involved in cell wall biosynthesis
MPQSPASPRVTVIIPTYNWSSVLPYSIGSVLRQRFGDFELLVVGDGCTDESEAVVTAIPDPRVRWINLPVNDGNQSAPNNEGIRQARGSIIAYLGHDDLWLPHHLEVMVAAIDAGAGLAHSIVHMIVADGGLFRPAGEIAGYRPGEWLPPTGVAHVKIAAERVGGWRNYRDLSGEPEADLWRRMHEAGFAVRSVPRLTALKFPAISRKDCYKTRPNHEQQFWTGRILGEADLEAVELAKLLVQAEREQRRRLPLAADIRALLARIPSGFRRRLRLAQSKPLEKGEMIRQRRKVKGLDMSTDRQ